MKPPVVVHAQGPLGRGAEHRPQDAFDDTRDQEIGIGAWPMRTSTIGGLRTVNTARLGVGLLAPLLGNEIL
jgi:hypothetical protein